MPAKNAVIKLAEGYQVQEGKLDFFEVKYPEQITVTSRFQTLVKMLQEYLRF